MTKHILMFEPSFGGHQLDIIRYLLEAIERNLPDARVTLLMTPSAAGHASTRQVLSDFSGVVTLRLAPEVTAGNRTLRAISGFYEYQWRNAEMLARGLAEIGPANVDFVVLPYMETIGLLQLGTRPALFRGKPWATIGFTVRFHHRKAGVAAASFGTHMLQGWFLRRILRDPALACFGTIDPTLFDTVKHPKLLYCPDPCEPPAFRDKAKARAAYGLRQETCVILIFGRIDQRKCAGVLIEAAARLVPELDLTVFLAGQQIASQLAPALTSTSARKLREHGRLVEANRFISREGDIDPMNAADIAWVFYDPKFVTNSGVLVRAAMFGRPVVARRLGRIGQLVDRHQCGLTVPSDSPEAVAEALRRLVVDPELRTSMGENGERVFAGHTPDDFAQPVADAIARSLYPAAVAA